ncbi:choline transport protein [Rhizoctonia solani]|uniref:Choline transport protein n=1 Tax=Rhizoctonia solani TaxID=456999 RepID=A0A8H8NWK7_9AGAM|nr:choline transport protein [Rhizoctonia solani]QRW21259.1 choline transport protein [Rhizoctonia solani]
MSSDAPARPEPTAVQSGPSETTISFPQVIPPVDGLALPGRSLVLCFDGTGDQYDHDVSPDMLLFLRYSYSSLNVELEHCAIRSAPKKDDKKRQMVYYQTGIGTGVGPQPSGVFTSKLSQTLDTMIASGLGDHVRGGYEFLMQNWDRISIFGFSRGAYTARALAGMLHKVGLLPAYNHEQVAFAYKMFKRDDEEGWKMSNGFKRAFCIDVKIDFVGVFDTVNSVGIIPRELPFAKSNYLIRVFRHAVALDEHRAKFQPNLWGRSTESEEKLGEAGKKKVYHRQKSKSGVWSYVYGGHQTDVKEVWFAGAHCDVGGGSVPNETPNNLARIPLRWMIRECFLNNTGILFHSAELEEIGLSPPTLWPTVKIPTPIADGHKPQASDATMVDSPEEVRDDPMSSKTKINGVEPPKTMSALVPPEFIKLGSEADAKDALEPIYDQLSIAKWWWILELLPMKKRYQRHDKSWSTWLSINFGGPRVIHGQKRFGVLVHRTVQYRMQQLGYKPRAELLAEPGPTWVD